MTDYCQEMPKGVGAQVPNSKFVKPAIVWNSTTVEATGSNGAAPKAPLFGQHYETVKHHGSRALTYC